jgi:pyrroline-5-carboxylate reductase
MVVPVSPVILPPVAILGTGSMGGAILAGLVRPEVESNGIVVTNRSVEKARALAGDKVVSLATSEDPDANRVAVRDARIVLIGVKPVMVSDLLREIAGDLEPDAIVVSVAAGVTIATMEALVPVSVIRSMPNTPSVVGRGVTGIAPGSRTTEDQLDLVRTVFETVGEVLVVTEPEIDTLGTISGSGPAYVFFLIEQLTGAAVRMGFTEEQAALMVNNTFLGAAELLAASDVPPAELRRRVTSPNGTTERAVAVLADSDLGGVFDRATAAALARTKELAAGS